LNVSSLTPRLVFHVGRALLASLFILGGLNKIRDAAPSIVRMAEIEVPVPSLTVFVIIALELGLGLILAGGEWFKHGRYISAAAFLLILHTAAINVLLHPFWLMEGTVAATELSLFFKNLSIMGGLAMIAALYWDQTIFLKRIDKNSV